MTDQLAFLGLGVMGAPMTANLARVGFSVKAWNRTPDRPGVKIAAEAGATIVSSIQAAVESAAIIFTCVGDVPDVEEVVLGANGIAQSAQPGALIVDTSTIGSTAAKRIGAELAKWNCRFLDAPISGGDIGAQQGTLTFMVGGAAEDFAQCKPYFQAMGTTIRHCGVIGSGQAVKMCNQTLCASYMVALCEAMQLAQGQGIDPNLVVEVCGSGAAASWALTNLGPKIIAQDYAPGFSIEHILKDLRLVKEIAIAAEQDIPGVDLAYHLFEMVRELDGGQGAEQGTQAMIRAYSQLPIKMKGAQ